MNNTDFDKLISREDFQNDLMNFELFSNKEKEAFKLKYSINKDSFIKASTILDTLNFREKEFSEVELEYLWGRLDTDIKNKKQEGKILKPNFADWFMKIAAILVFPLLIASLWMYFNPIELEKTMHARIVSPLGTRTQFSLPDGTSGWLNNGSSLAYNSNFMADRKVDLVGEAYFDVVHKNKQNFVVNTIDFSVEVLGTKFNVSAYDEDIESSVVLKEGKVKINSRRNGISELLKPDELFTLNKSTKTALISNVTANDHIVWSNGQLRFRNEPLSEVIKKMGRWYNVDFEITDEKLLNYKYRANFQDEPIEEILRMISITTPITYSIENRLTNKNGTYEKKKIVIKIRE